MLRQPFVEERKVERPLPINLYKRGVFLLLLFKRGVMDMRKKTFTEHNANEIKVSIHMLILRNPASPWLYLLAWIKQALLHQFLKRSVRARSKGPLELLRLEMLFIDQLKWHKPNPWCYVCFASLWLGFRASGGQGPTTAQRLESHGVLGRDPTWLQVSRGWIWYWRAFARILLLQVLMGR